MIFKVLLPLMVGFLVYFLGRSHARSGQRHQHPSSTTQKPTSARMGKFRTSFRLIAYVLAGSALFSASWFIYESWSTTQKILNIRIINTQTGEKATYQAFQGEVHGRVFRTTDGRQIRLANVERMEIDREK